MVSMREVRLTWDRENGRYHRARGVATDPYLRGPIKLAWLQAAARLPGKALAVGIALWHLAGLRRTHSYLPLSSERLAPFGVSRYAKDRALLCGRPCRPHGFLAFAAGVRRATSRACPLWATLPRCTVAGTAARCGCHRRLPLARHGFITGPTYLGVPGGTWTAH
jgi:hypothetical protein